MPPDQIIARPRTMSKRDWDEYKDRIKLWYITQKMKQQDVIGKLGDLGFVVERTQLAYQVKKWGWRKNLTSATAIYLNNELEQRKQAGKQTTTVIASGNILSDQKIKRALRRHVRPKWKPDSVPNSPGTGGQLIVCTPPEVPAEGLWRGWPHTPHPLPFIKFSMLAQTSNTPLRFSVPAGSLHWNTNTEALSQFFHLNALDIPSTLDRFVPEAFEGDNMRLAASLGHIREPMDIGVFKLIIFELSNNSTHWAYSRQMDLVMGLWNSLGHAKLTLLNTLYQLAPKEPSILAALGAMFMGGCSIGSEDLVRTMIEYDPTKYNERHAWITPDHIAKALEMAIKSKNLDLADRLLSKASRGLMQEAIINVRELQPVLDRLFSEKSLFAMIMIKKFLTSKIWFRGDKLLHAITASNAELLKLLVDNNTNLDYKANSFFRPCSGSIPGQITVDGLDATAAAVTCSCRNCEAHYSDTLRPNMILKTHCQDCETQAKEMLKLVHGLRGNAPEVSLGLLIIAAARGFNDIICTFARSPKALNKANESGFWPLFAAVTCGRLDTCRILLQRGARPDYRPPAPLYNVHQFPPLHQAAFLNHVDIARELLKYGAQMEHRCASDRKGRKGETSLGESHLTPLEVAILRKCKEAFEFLIEQGAKLITEDSNLLVLNWEHKSADGRTIRKEKLSIVTVSLLTASCTGSIALLEVLRTSVHRNALDKAWSEAIGTAIECSEYPMVFFLMVQLEIAQESWYNAWPIILQAVAYCPNKDITSLVCQTSIGLGIPNRWFAYAAGAFPTETILHHFPHLSDPGLMQRNTLEGKSSLEMAILNPNPGVAHLFLQQFPGEYDSGALCTSVLRAAKLCDHEPVWILIKRRNSAAKHTDPVLENTAIGLAGYFKLFDIFTSLLERPYPGDLSVVPGYPNNSKQYREKNDGCVVNPFTQTYVQTWTQWRTLTPSPLGSLLNFVELIPEGGDRESIISLMIAKGYRFDKLQLWMEVALKSSGQLLNSLMESYEDVNTWRPDDWEIKKDNSTTIFGCHTALQRSITAGRLDIARLLINKGADVNQRKAKGSAEEKIPRCDSCLQIAVRDLDGAKQEEAVSLLLGEGADLHAPAPWEFGATALQYAALQGNFRLVRRFIDMGANINEPRGLLEGRTCLEGAAEHGRLDMVQYLLNTGANTEGTGRLQYIYATLLAEGEGHRVVASLLRRHRPWDATDEALYEELGEVRSEWDKVVILHPEEYHLAEECSSLQGWWDNNMQSYMVISPGIAVWPSVDSDLADEESLDPEEEQEESEGEMSEEEELVVWEDWITEDVFP
ncbi:hypothetical protein F5Y14DRAFT_338038 [Nemania sp. NC0429]|nr:hypothetical protein F5Y14DRAFT_338038 [Nemania sp. NC0429]